MPTRAVAEVLLRLVLGAVLAYAGWQKLLEPSLFVEQVANYQLWPESARFVAALLPPTELVAAAAVWLMPAAWRRAGALLACVLFAMFTFAVARAVWLGINVDCGCFGAGSGAIGAWTVVRNVALTAAAAALVWIAPGPTEQPR